MALPIKLEQFDGADQKAQASEGGDLGTSFTRTEEVAASPTFPEGGLPAWLTVLGGSMILFCTFGVVQSFGVYQDYYTRVSLNEHTPSEISWIGSIQVFLLFAMGLPAGKLFDEGYFRHLMVSGSLLYSFSFFMLSLVKPHQYYQNLLSQGIGMGIGMGLMFLPAISVASHYFRAKRSLAMGVVLSGSSLGAMIYPIMLNNLFERSTGFALGVRAAAFLDLGLLLIGNILMRTRLPSRKDRPNSRPISIRRILSDGPYLVFVAGTFFVFWGIFVPFFYLQLYAALHGVSATLVTYSIAILNAASVLGRTVPNFAADKFGQFNVMIPSTIISGGLIFALFGVSSTVGVILFGIFYGFFSGGFISLATPAAVAFANDLDEIGIRIGLTSFVISFAVLTGNPIAGALLSPPKYTWWRPFLFASLVVLFGALCFIISRRMLIKRRCRVL